MKKEEFEARKNRRRRQFIDWLFEFLIARKGICLTNLALATGKRYETLAHLKGGSHAKRRRLSRTSSTASTRLSSAVT